MARTILECVLMVASSLLGSGHVSRVWQGGAEIRGSDNRDAAKRFQWQEMPFVATDNVSALAASAHSNTISSSGSTVAPLARSVGNTSAADSASIRPRHKRSVWIFGPQLLGGFVYVASRADSRRFAKALRHAARQSKGAPRQNLR